MYEYLCEVYRVLSVWDNSIIAFQSEREIVPKGGQMQVSECLVEKEGRRDVITKHYLFIVKGPQFTAFRMYESVCVVDELVWSAIHSPCHTGQAS